MWLLAHDSEFAWKLTLAIILEPPTCECRLNPKDLLTIFELPTSHGRLFPSQHAPTGTRKSLSQPPRKSVKSGTPRKNVTTSSLRATVTLRHRTLPIHYVFSSPSTSCMQFGRFRTSTRDVARTEVQRTRLTPLTRLQFPNS